MGSDGLDGGSPAPLRSSKDFSRAIFPALPGFRQGQVDDKTHTLFEQGEGEEGAQQAFEVGDTLALIAEVRQSVEGHRANKALPLADRVRFMEEEKRRLQMALEVLEMEELHVLDAEQLYQPPVSNQEVEDGPEPGQGLGQGVGHPLGSLNNQEDALGGGGGRGGGRPPVLTSSGAGPHPLTTNAATPHNNEVAPLLEGRGAKPPPMGHASFLAELNDKKANLRRPTPAGDIIIDKKLFLTYHPIHPL